ncbi:hypothetical protein [Stenoxybacter acetivorans]|uniref:hypothetical protein n=1 Tax=Stenoxybacter acetivorans TaxID=422441 RepID=UPI000564BC7C|nr:hypothetical protein [Stenoxybacter acetivorans]
MAFVNEIVSEEDIQKYGLDELMSDFNPFSLYWRKNIKERPSTFRHAWTIDRERNIYFMLVKRIDETGPSGRPEPTNKSIFILDFQGRRVCITVERAYCSPSFSDNPFQIVWDLLEIDASAVPKMPKTEVIDILKEALLVYGYEGAKYQKVPNTVVKFNF